MCWECQRAVTLSENDFAGQNQRGLPGAAAFAAESEVKDSYHAPTVVNSLQRFLEWYWGLPSTEPGQVARWSVTAHAPWSESWPTVLIVVVIAAAVLVVAEIYRRDARTLSLSRRAVLIGLRCCVLGLVVLMLSRVSVSVERSGLPLVVVLIDDSASMGLRDAYKNEADRQALTELLNSTASEGERFDLARRLLTHDNGLWLMQLQQRHKVRVARFSAEVVPLGSDLTEEASVQSLLAELQNVKPTGDVTRPAEAVRQVLNQTRGTPPAAIVLLTDGIASSGDADKLSTVVPLAKEQFVPLFVIGFGSDEPTRDVQLAELLADDVAFVNDPILFASKIKAFGLAGQTATVELRERGRDKPLAQKKITLSDDGKVASVDLLFTPTESGEKEFEVVAVPPPGDVDATNNRLSHHVRVREGKLKILLADGLPRWEFRELKNTLEREPTIELHTLLQDADLEFALQDETAKHLKGRFPLTLDALAYDVIVLGDVNPGALPPGVLDNVREFVRNGGGLLVVAGPQHMPQQFRGSPIEVLLPIEISSVKVPALDAELREPFRVSVTEAGFAAAPWLRHLELESPGHDVWRSLPGLFWLCEVPRLKAGASVLLEDPQRRGEKQPLPVVALQRFGAGKVLLHATDELWRWRFRGGEKMYSRYWIQTLRFLSRSQQTPEARGVEFTSDRQVYQRGEPVRFRLQVLNERQLTDVGRVVLVIERADEPRRTLELSRAANSPNVWTGDVRGLRDGRYHAWVQEPTFPGAPPAVDFRIESPQRELQRRRLDRVDLEAAARASYGKYFALSEAHRVPSELPPGQPVPLEAATVLPLWTRWELLLLFATLLCSEWLCRRRWRLV